MSAANKADFPPILIVHEDESSVRITLRIDPELHWFKGHFPDGPVLPGIVQLHWAVKIAGERLGFEGVPYEIKRLKFKRLVIPPDTLELIVTRCSDTEAQFEFLRGGEQCSLGRLLFAGN